MDATDVVPSCEEEIMDKPPVNIINSIELAGLLGCEVETLNERAHAGELPGLKFGRSWCFPIDALNTWLCELAIKQARERQDDRTTVIHAANEPEIRGDRRRRPPPSLQIAK